MVMIGPTIISIFFLSIGTVYLIYFGLLWGAIMYLVAIFILYIFLKNDIIERPEKILIGQRGIVLKFRYRKQIDLKWEEICGIYRTEEKCGLKLDFKFQTYQITTEVCQIICASYNMCTGKDYPRWDGGAEGICRSIVRIRRANKLRRT